MVPGDATELKIVTDTLLGDTSGISADKWRDTSCQLCDHNTTGKTVIMGDSYVNGMRPEAQQAAGGAYPDTDTAPLAQFGPYVLLGNGGKRYNDGIAALAIDQLVSETPLFINGDPSRIIINLGLNDIMFPIYGWAPASLDIINGMETLVSVLRRSAPTAKIHVVFPFFYSGCPMRAVDATQCWEGSDWTKEIVVSDGKCSYGDTHLTHDYMIALRDSMIARAPENVHIIDYFSKGCQLAQDPALYMSHIVDVFGHHNREGQKVFLDFLYEQVSAV